MWECQEQLCVGNKSKNDHVLEDTQQIQWGDSFQVYACLLTVEDQPNLQNTPENV